MSEQEKVLTAEMVKAMLDADAYILPPEFDGALMGWAYRGALKVAVYHANKVVAVYESQGMDYDEALEFFEFNTEGAWVGPGTPYFVFDRWMQ